MPHEGIFRMHYELFLVLLSFRKFLLFFPSIIFYSFFNHSQPISLPLNYKSKRKTGTTYMTNKLVERSQSSNKKELIARTEYSTVGKLHILGHPNFDHTDLA